MTTNAQILSRRNAAVVRGVASATTISIQRALNSEVWDVEGKRYVDFAGGIAVLNTGHCHPHVIGKVTEQLGRFTHPCIQVLLYEPYIELAEKLNKLVPISEECKTILLTTGAEATENAVKIARVATGRPGVIAFAGSFHGRTTLAMNLTGKVVPYKKGLGPSLPDIWHVPFPTEQNGVTVEETLRHLSFLFKADVDPSRVAAIIIEPVQGEGGFHPAHPELMRALRRICDQNGIVLIVDEIQTGFGRTGKMFAMEHYDIEPDLICIAKSLSGGFPLAAVVGRSKLMDAAEPGGLGGTFAGNPLACAAALAVLEVFEKERLLERANAIGARLTKAIAAWHVRNDVIAISKPRGLGAMIGFDVLKSRGDDEPDAEATKRILQRAHQGGLILLSCGVNANTIRVLVPLTASDEIVEEGLGILEKALIEEATVAASTRGVT